MKTKLIEALNRPAPFKAVLVVLVPCILGTLTMRAGDQTYNMDDDPHEMPGLLIFGNHEPAAWQPNDGDPALGGYFSFADAVSGQNTAVVLPQMDLFTNADGSIVDMPTKAFKLELDLRMGNGSERPADGFSISFCRLDDPVLTVASNYVTGSGMDITSGFAGGDSPEQANDPNGSANVENGTKTGLAIVLDTYEGNWLPMNGVATNLNEFGSNDRQGIAVRVNDVTLVQVSLPDRNGNCTDPSCADFACMDPNSLQTGPYTGDSSYAPLCWQHLSVELNTEQQLTILWKGNIVVDHYTLTSWFPSAGRFVLAGRTGGAWQNCHVDNVHVVTTPALEAIVNGTVGGPPILMAAQYEDNIQLTWNSMPGQSYLIRTKAELDHAEWQPYAAVLATDYWTTWISKIPFGPGAMFFEVGGVAVDADHCACSAMKFVEVKPNRTHDTAASSSANADSKTGHIKIPLFFYGTLDCDPGTGKCSGDVQTEVSGSYKLLTKAGTQLRTGTLKNAIMKPNPAEPEKPCDGQTHDWSFSGIVEADTDDLNINWSSFRDGLTKDGYPYLQAEVKIKVTTECQGMKAAPLTATVVFDGRADGSVGGLLRHVNDGASTFKP